MSGPVLFPFVVKHQHIPFVGHLLEYYASQRLPRRHCGRSHVHRGRAQRGHEPCVPQSPLGSAVCCRRGTSFRMLRLPPPPSSFINHDFCRSPSSCLLQLFLSVTVPSPRATPQSLPSHHFHSPGCKHVHRRRVGTSRYVSRNISTNVLFPGCHRSSRGGLHQVRWGDAAWISSSGQA
jgi:hypothetical protein